MALYREDIVDIELTGGNIHRSFAKHSIGSGDAAANRFGVRVFRDGEPVILTGATCEGFFRQGNHAPIALTDYGTVSGNVAYVTLPQACYNYEGQYVLAIKLVSSSVTGTMRIVDGMVDNTGSDAAVAPTESIPTYQEILAVYEDMIEVKEGSVLFNAEQELTSAQKETARGNIDVTSTIQSMTFNDRDTNITDSRMLKAIGVYNINTSWYTDLTSDFGSGKVGALICFGNPVNSQIYHILYLETGEMYTRWVHKSSASAGTWVHINAVKDFTNVLNLKSRESTTDAKQLPVGFFNCNTSWYTDLEEELGESLIGVLFVYGNPNNQHYQMFIQETGDIYIRWVNAAGTNASAFQHVAKPFKRTNRYFAFGDSRVYGYLSGSGDQSQYRYPKFIADQMGLVYSNYAVSGSGLWERNNHQAAIDRVQSVDDLDEATLITIEWGVNDYQHPIGTYEDTGDSTWCGRLYQLISYIMEIAPNATLIVIGSANTAEGTQANGWGYGYTLSSGWSLGGLIDEEAKLCAKYHIPFISGYDDPFNDFNIESLMPDDLHYLDQGYLMRSRYLYGKIRALMGVNVPEQHAQ